jgi:hypothetical protein
MAEGGGRAGRAGRGPTRRASGLATSNAPSRCSTPTSRRGPARGTGISRDRRMLAARATHVRGGLLSPSAPRGVTDEARAPTSTAITSGRWSCSGAPRRVSRAGARRGCRQWAASRAVMRAGGEARGELAVSTPRSILATGPVSASSSLGTGARGLGSLSVGRPPRSGASGAPPAQRSGRRDACCWKSGAKSVAGRAAEKDWIASIESLVGARRPSEPEEFPSPSTEEEPSGRLLVIPYASVRLARRCWAALENRHSRPLISASEERVVGALAAQLRVLLENVAIWRGTRRRPPASRAGEPLLPAVESGPHERSGSWGTRRR